MQSEERVGQQFGNIIESLIATADSLTPDISKAAHRLADCLLADKKILICGNGGSAANAFHFTAAMIHHFGVDRPALPIINLSGDTVAISSIAADNTYDQIYARQIFALGQPDDVLITLSTSGNSNSVLQAVYAANERGLDTIALLGREGGVLSNRLGPEDLPLLVAASCPARIREIHLFILHSFCNLIDNILFKGC